MAGYMSWGRYGWDFYYVFNGAVRFFGDSSWYIIATFESWNGWLLPTDLGDYVQWLHPYAFGGINHESTPVGAVCHVKEPQSFGVNDGTLYFGAWAKGRSFTVSAWLSRRTPQHLVVGDPLTKR